MENRQPLCRIESVTLNGALIKKETKYIIECTQRGDVRIITLGNALLLFSSYEGDAWLLDMEDKVALQLVDLGVILPYQIIDAEDTFSIEWKGLYEISENGFAVKDENENIRLFPNYPIREIQNRVNDTSRFSQDQIDGR